MSYAPCAHRPRVYVDAPCSECLSAREVTEPDRKAARIAFLERKRLVTIEDLKVKLEAEDWHGCQDCASDLRDIDNEMDGLKF